MPEIAPKPPSGFKVPLIISIVVNVLLIIALVVAAAVAFVLNNRTTDQVSQLQAENKALKAQVGGDAADEPVPSPGPAPAPSPAPAPACADQLIDINFGTYSIDCDWHSYFEVNIVEELSYGFAGEEPLLLLGATDAPVGDVTISVSQYSPSLGNYKANPLSDVLASAGSATVTDVTSANGIAFKKVVQSEFFESTAYYAQQTKGDSVYLVSFFMRGVDAPDHAADLMNTFEWTL